MIKDFRCRWGKRKKQKKEKRQRGRAFLKGRETSTVGLLFRIFFFFFFFLVFLSSSCFPSENALMSEETRFRETFLNMII